MKVSESAVAKSSFTEWERPSAITQQNLQILLSYCHAATGEAFDLLNFALLRMSCADVVQILPALLSRSPSPKVIEGALGAPESRGANLYHGDPVPGSALSPP